MRTWLETTLAIHPVARPSRQAIDIERDNILGPPSRPASAGLIDQVLESRKSLHRSSRRSASRRGLGHPGPRRYT